MSKLEEKLDEIEDYIEYADTSAPIDVNTKVCVEETAPMLLQAVREANRECEFLCQEIDGQKCLPCMIKTKLEKALLKPDYEEEEDD